MPEDMRRACKAIKASRKKIRESLFRHRDVLTLDEQNALEGCDVVLQGVERRLQRPPEEDRWAVAAAT